MGLGGLTFTTKGYKGVSQRGHKGLWRRERRRDEEKKTKIRVIGVIGWGKNLGETS